MRILAFDTALAAISVAIRCDGAVRAHAFELRARGHAEALMPLIATVCRDAGVPYAALDRLVVTVGPGSFAGTRVGLAAARGLALALDRPVIGITTLEAVAFGLPAAGGLKNGTADEKPAGAEDVIVAVFDAYRAEVYFQMFGPALHPLTPPLALPPAAAADRIGNRRAILCGNGAARLAPELDRRGTACTVAPDRDYPDAALFAALGETRQPGATPPAPLYLRPPDARLPGARPSDLRVADGPG